MVVEKIITTLTTKLIAALTDSNGDLPLFNSGPKLKKEAVIFKKSSSNGGIKYINKTPIERIVKTCISLDVTTFPSSLAFSNLREVGSCVFS